MTNTWRPRFGGEGGFFWYSWTMRRTFMAGLPDYHTSIMVPPIYFSHRG